MEIEAGTLVITDARTRRGVFEALVASDWDGAPFRLPGPHGALAVRVEVTGRTVRHTVAGLAGVGVVRARITFVGDGEPDEVTGGWIRAEGFGADFRLVTAEA